MITKYRGKQYKSLLDASKHAARDLSNEEEDYVTRRFAVTALQSYGPETAAAHAETLVNALQTDEDVGVRYCVVGLLAIMAKAGSAGSAHKAISNHAEAVVGALREPDPGIRFWAATALEGIGPSAAEHSSGLIDMLGDSDPDVRVAVAKAIRAVTPGAAADAAKVVSAELASKDSFFRASAAESLGALGPDATPYAQKLGKALKDKYAKVRLAAASALGKAGPEAVKVVAASLAKVSQEDVDADVRAAAALALQQYAPSDALQDKSAPLRIWGAMTLSKSLDAVKTHAAALGAALKDKKPEVRYWAVVGLGTMGPDAAEFEAVLTAAVNDADGFVSLAATRAVKNVCGRPSLKKIVVMLTRRLQHKKETVRACAAEALSVVGDVALPQAGALRDVLTDEDFHVKLNALRALADMGAPAVRPGGAAIAELAKSDPDPEIRRTALKILLSCNLAQRFGLSY
mmetsp:Transcript_167922/g.322421  ORF Transcript_167922/g.322421 Transcript_167922/m.322421 type:complete len:460 (-) Transcript_167922:15-1394(-)